MKTLTKYWLCLFGAGLNVILAAIVYPAAQAATDFFMCIAGFFAIGAIAFYFDDEP